MFSFARTYIYLEHIHFFSSCLWLFIFTLSTFLSHSKILTTFSLVPMLYPVNPTFYPIYLVSWLLTDAFHLIKTQLSKEAGFGCYSSKFQLNSSTLTTLNSVHALENVSTVTVSACFFGYYPVSNFQLPKALFTMVCWLREVIWKWNLKCILNIPTQECWFCALFLHGGLDIVQDTLH